MPVVTTTRTVDDDGLAGLRQDRHDLVVETAVGVDRWQAETGPFSTYRRTLDVAAEAAPEAGGPTHRVTETTEFTLAIPVWTPLINPLMKRALRDPDRTPRRRWWWPREVVTERTSRLVGSLAVISVIAGYLGVIIGQTIAFAAEEFGDDDSAQANTLAGTRLGVIISIVVLRYADRIGRRPLIIGFTSAAIVATVLGSLAPNLAVLGASQTISRGLTTALITLLVLSTTEEVPSEVRAFSISLIAISAALGAGMVVWVLSLADVVDNGWRLVYLVPVLFVPLFWWVIRHLPETRRFDAATADEAPAKVRWKRFALIGGSAFASALFLSPASQLRNEFLRDDQGYSAAAVSLFQLVVSTPAATAIVIAGVLADRMGRRAIAAVGLGTGTLMMALSYQLESTALWVVACLGVVLTGAAGPATRGYSTELFPTRARARVGGWLDGVGMAGSALGLIIVGWLSERWDDLGAAVGVMVFAPVLVAVVIWLFYPETASEELELFNPDDPGVTPTPSETRSKPSA